MLELFLLGGWVMYPILACSVLSWAVIAERCWYFFRTRNALSEAGPRFQHLAKTAELLRDQGADARERALKLAAEPFLKTDDRGLTLLSAVATLGPLLGLFGTVLGMIELFQSMASGARPEFSNVVGGIWTALLTTAFGLIAAIPAQAAHHWFDHTADSRSRALQSYAGQRGLEG